MHTQILIQQVKCREWINIQTNLHLIQNGVYANGKMCMCERQRVLKRENKMCKIDKEIVINLLSLIT